MLLLFAIVHAGDKKYTHTFVRYDMCIICEYSKCIRCSTMLSAFGCSFGSVVLWSLDIALRKEPWHSRASSYVLNSSRQSRLKACIHQGCTTYLSSCRLIKMHLQNVFHSLMPHFSQQCVSIRKTVTYCVSNILSYEMTEQIVQWKVQLHVFSNNANAEEGCGKRELFWGIKT